MLSPDLLITVYREIFAHVRKGLDFFLRYLYLARDGTLILSTACCLLLFLATTHGEGYNDQASSIQQTRDVGRIIVAGGTALLTPNDPDFLVLEPGPNGGVDWQKLYGKSYIDIVSIVQQTSDGRYIVPGETRSFGAGKEDLWVLKLRADGTIEWQKTYGGNYDDRGSISLQTNDGGYIVSGWTDSFGAGKKDLLVLRLRPDGSFVYAQDRSIDPACESVKETDLSAKDSNATVKDTTVSPIDSNANPQDSPAIVQDTNAPVDLFCLPTTVKP